jgi:serine/threonine-protein kinase
MLAGAVVAAAIVAVPVARADFGGPRGPGVGAEVPGAGAPGASPSASGAANPTAPRAQATPTGGLPAGGGGAQPVPPRGAASPTPRRPVVPPGNPPPAPGPQPAPPPPAPLPGVPIVSLGGIVRVACSGSTTSVLGVDLAVGYSIKDYDPGPAREVQVVLLSIINESEIKVTCHRGEPRPKVKESPQ